MHGYVADGTTPGQLNLDNLRTEMRQHPCRDGAGDHVSQVYDSDVFEREFAFVVFRQRFSLVPLILAFSQREKGLVTWGHRWFFVTISFR